jgi:hypothetical protein
MTKPNPELPHVSPDAELDAVAARREQTRARVARHRALKRQAASIEFVRTDASLFLHPDRLSQKAGAPRHHLRRMALKELVDNALDAASTVTLTEDPDTFVVQDDGPGFDPEKVFTLFSVTRPMMSTKVVRRPTRGMVGNGLRVATGAAFASGGTIVVESRGVRQELTFDRETGETMVAGREPCWVGEGTRITIRFGAALPRDESATSWGDVAIRLAGPSARPMLTHPDWYSEPAFEELVAAARGTAQDLATLFGVDLCNAPVDTIERGQTGSGQRYTDPDMPADTVSLDILQCLAPKPPKLLPVSDHAFPGAYRIEKAVVDIAGATVPAIVQAWARETGGRANVQINLVVNRTPAVADLSLYLGGDSYLRGCGLFCPVGQVARGSYQLTIAITTPAIALVSDGKTPDLKPFADALTRVVGPVLRRAHQPASRGTSIKDAAFDVMEEAYLKASAGGTLPANARQIMYAARPFILEATGQAKLNDAYFTQTLLPAFMEENADLTSDWDVVYDARGHLVEPHTDHSLPLGTIHVREYLQRRPRLADGSLLSLAAGLHPTVGPGDRYGAVLFIEKEGFEPLLRAARIAERFDIAIMSTKGMSVIAARALVDRLSSQGVTILVAHDLDIAGIRNFGTLGADSSRYQFKSSPDIRRLGLTLKQATSMDLQREKQEVQGDHQRVLLGLRRHGASRDELTFLAGGSRVELNAMTSDQFVAWIEQGLRQHGVQKVVPPAEMIEARARHLLGLRRLRRDVAELEQAARRRAAEIELPADLRDRLRGELDRDPTQPWEDALGAVLSVEE